MKYLLSLLFAVTLSAAPRSATVSTWSACDTGGRSVTLRQDAGDVVTLQMPGPKKVPLRVALLTQAVSGNFNGQQLTATFWIDASNPAYTGANAGGCIRAVNVRLYFTTTTGSYKVSDADRNPTRYWWARNAFAYIEQVDDGQLVTLTATVLPEQWSNANGQLGEWLPAEFASAAANVRQIGFSFGGGCYYDTGVGMASGQAVVHVVSVQ